MVKTISMQNDLNFSNLFEIWKSDALWQIILWKWTTLVIACNHLYVSIFSPLWKCWKIWKMFTFEEIFEDQITILMEIHLTWRIPVQNSGLIGIKMTPLHLGHLLLEILRLTVENFKKNYYMFSLWRHKIFTNFWPK